MIQYRFKWAMVIIFLLPFSVQGSLVLEPYLGQILSLSSASQTESSVQYTRKLDGLLYGGRVGYGLLGFSAGIDYAQSSFDAEITAPLSQVTTWRSQGTSIVSSVSGRYFGLFVGYDLPMLFRAWATFFPSVRYEFGNGDPIEGQKDLWKGTGFSIGLGFYVLPLISLNYDLRSFNFDEKFQNSTQSTKDLSKEYESVEHLVSLGVPFSF